MRRMRDPIQVITFRDYVYRVACDPTRKGEMEILREVFGEAFLKKVLDGLVTLESKDFAGVVK